MTKALVVDDSSTVRSIISRMLGDLGIHSVQAGNGQEALQMLQAEKDVSIAFVDWNMPVMNGLEFVRAARREQGYSAIKIIMVTTETEMHQIQLAIDSGVDEYIMKPFTREMFEEKLAMMQVETPSKSET